MKLWIETVLGPNRETDFNELGCPVTTEVKEGEKILGTIEGKPRIFKIVAERLDAQASAMIEAHNELHDKKQVHSTADCDKLLVDVSDLEDRAKVLRDLFWIEVKQAIPEAAAVEHGIGVRKDWQIVAMPEPKGSSLASLIGGRGGILVVSSGSIDIPKS